MTVTGLLPGDLVQLGPSEGLFVCRVPHPLYPGLLLVVWRLDDGWSFDALLPHQDVGEVVPALEAERHLRLAEALLEG